MTALFDVTFEIITEESAADGDAAERGYICEDCSLRSAMHTALAIDADITAIECDSSPCAAPRWITVYGGMDIHTGEYENRSLHIPDSVTPSSRRRITRLMGARS